MPEPLDYRYRFLLIDEKGRTLHESRFIYSSESSADAAGQRAAADWNF